jgi:hypothetical protein
LQIKIVSCQTATSKPVKQEVNGTVILPPLVFPAYSLTKEKNALAYSIGKVAGKTDQARQNLTFNKIIQENEAGLYTRGGGQCLQTDRLVNLLRFLFWLGGVPVLLVPTPLLSNFCQDSFPPEWHHFCVYLWPVL